MAKKRIVSIPNADKKTLEDAYALWGTTRDEHLEKMKRFIALKKAEAGISQDEAPVVNIGRRAAAEPIYVRRAAIKPAVKRAWVERKGEIMTGSGKSEPTRGVVIKYVDDPRRGSGMAERPRYGRFIKNVRGGISLAELKGKVGRVIEVGDGKTLLVVPQGKAGKGSKGLRFKGGPKGGGFKK